MNQSANGPLDFRASQPQRILVVEQDPFLLHLSAEVLIQHGYEVNATEDAAAAWKELQAINYNLLITDYKLPKVTGLGLIKKLHAARLALPVVLVAEKIPTLQLAKFRWLQPAVTLLKPIAADTLLADCWSPTKHFSPCPDELAARASTITPVLQEILEHGIEHSHWGLNE